MKKRQPELATRCHHPPFLLSIDPRGSLSGRQLEALEAVAVRAAENPDAPVLLVGLGDAYLQVVECSWCRRQGAA